MGREARYPFIGTERVMMIQKIISGGQTGAGRGALDVAIKFTIPHGGWIPKGRKTEDGPLPDRYHLQEMPTATYGKRTEQNVIDSDGTLIISHGRLTGGSALTRDLAKDHGRPWLHIDLNTQNRFQAAMTISSWITRHKIETLNVAGPRASRDPEIYQATVNVLTTTLYLNIVETTAPRATYTPPSLEDLMGVVTLPKTVEEAVGRVISELSLRDKAHIAKLIEQDLPNLQSSLGHYIRTAFGLWSGNSTLMESCCSILGVSELNEDDVSAVIIREVWEQLRETHRMRVVK
jgi:hypothetical protein